MQTTRKDPGPSLFEVLKEKSPFKISEVTVQKSDSSRVSIFSEGKFLFGIAAIDAHELGLSKGTVVKPEQIKNICSAIDADQIKSFLLRLLAKRPYPRRILFNKLITKGFLKHSAELVLSDFEERGWIDDESYARSYVNDKYNLARWGPKKIEMYLKRDGISEYVIQHALKSLEPSESLTDTLKKLVNKRKLHFLREKDTFKRKKKVVDYLLRKGFNPDEVFKQIDKLLLSLEK